MLARLRPVEEAEVEKGLAGEEHAGDDGGEGEEIAEEAVGEVAGDAGIAGHADVAPGGDEVEVDVVEDAPDEDGGQGEQDEMMGAGAEGRGGFGRGVLAGDNMALGQDNQQAVEEDDVAEPGEGRHVHGDEAGEAGEESEGRMAGAQGDDFGVGVDGAAAGAMDVEPEEGLAGEHDGQAEEEGEGQATGAGGAGGAARRWCRWLAERVRLGTAGGSCGHGVSVSG